MGIYIFLFIYIIICFFAYKFKPSNNILKLLLFTIFLLFIIIQGFRDFYIGIDTISYINYINMQNSFTMVDFLAHRFEILFKILIKILVPIFTDYHFVFFIISFISALPVFKIIYKYSKNPFLSLLTYLAFGYYFLNFSLLRQGIAMGLTFYSIEYINNRDIKKFILIMIIASFFHVSALFFIPAYFLYNYKLNNKRIIKIFILSLILFVLKEQIFSLFIKYFFSNYKLQETGAYLWFLMCLIFWLFCYFISYKKSINKNGQNNALYTITLVGTLTMIFTSVGSNVLRISNYYYIFIVLLLPHAMSAISNAKNRMLISTLIVIAEIVLFYYLLTVDNQHVVPYIFGF